MIIMLPILPGTENTETDTWARVGMFDADRGKEWYSRDLLLEAWRVLRH